MYCQATNCRNNDGEGECMISSYIQIDEYGKCDELDPVFEEE